MTQPRDDEPIRHIIEAIGRVLGSTEIAGVTGRAVEWIVPATTSPSG